MTGNELIHYGVKGMRWGVRRYRNEDGTLTPAGKKRVSKQYKKLSVKTAKDLRKNIRKMQMTSYNKTADYMNREGIDKFNASQQKRYGKNYAQRSGYMGDYEAYFNKVLTKYSNRELNSFYNSNKNYQKSKELVEKYKLTSWDKLARDNEKAVESIRESAQAK